VLFKFVRDARIETVRDISMPAIEKWLGTLKHAGASADTLHTYARALKTFVGYLLERKLVGAQLQKFDILSFPRRGCRRLCPAGEMNRGLWFEPFWALELRRGVALRFNGHD